MNKYFTRILFLVEVDEQHDILQAYQMDNEEFSFGYEFVKNAVLRATTSSTCVASASV